MEFKDKLKKMRCEQNLSQQALADAIYVSRSAVAKWEAGLGLPCEESMQALENYFQVEKNHFLTDKPEELVIQKNIKIRKIATVFLCATLAILMVFTTLFAVATRLATENSGEELQNYDRVSEGRICFALGAVMFFTDDGEFLWLYGREAGMFVDFSTGDLVRIHYKALHNGSHAGASVCQILLLEEGDGSDITEEMWDIAPEFFVDVRKVYVSPDVQRIYVNPIQ